MKTNNEMRGGALKSEYYAVYAQYFVKYIQAMTQHGIPIHGITIQNEPLNSRNTPSMQWFYDQQAEFIANHLGPTFEKAQLDVDIMLFDHNADRIDYPLALLSDPEVDKYVSGSAFHHYRGDLSALSHLHQARPDKDIYFTEQMVVDWDREKPLQIASKVSRLVIGTTRNWSKYIILWNLAADANDDPHTDNGGCPFCQGALTIDGDQVIRNLAYYTIAHASKFVPSGSVRIASTAPGDQLVTMTTDEENPSIKRTAIIENVDVLPNVAFQTPDGYIVMIVANDTFDNTGFKIQYKGKTAEAKLAPGSVGTYKWSIK
jgi:glucosylceramidase